MGTASDTDHRCSHFYRLIVLLRVTGKRALSRMNAFDLVTVALGSMRATVLVSSEVTLA